MTLPSGSMHRPADRLRVRIVLVLSSTSLATGVAFSGGCGGSVESGTDEGNGTGGSRSGTGGTSSGTGGTAGGTGGSVAVGGIGGTFGGTAGVSGTNWGGTGGVAGAGGVGALGGSGGSLIYDGGSSCSAPTQCFTCAELASEFSWFLDSFSCGDSVDSGAAGAAAYECPDLKGIGTVWCQTVCTPPVLQGARCCYGLTPAPPACGRPFSVGEQLRTAKTVERDDWHAATYVASADLEVELLAALAREWEADATLEHASIASFARLTLQLLALGAPPDLVALSQAASLDEIEHARSCFALASLYGGHAIGPDRLDVEGALSGGSDLAVVASETVREGCIGETIAALLASEQLEYAGHPQVREVLARIASDEARHAELAWKIVRWAIAIGGQRVADAVASAFEQVLANLETALEAESEYPLEVSRIADWHEHGRLDAHERRAVIREAVSNVVRPCARILCGAPRA